MIRVLAIVGLLLMGMAHAVADEKGTVRWFDGKAGYGFIKPSKGGDEVFMHFSSIVGNNKSLKAGQSVLFKTDEEHKNQAIWVKPIKTKQVAQNDA